MLKTSPGVASVPIARRQDQETVYHDILGDLVLRIELWNDNQGLGGVLQPPNVALFTLTPT